MHWYFRLPGFPLLIDISLNWYYLVDKYSNYEMIENIISVM